MSRPGHATKKNSAHEKCGIPDSIGKTVVDESRDATEREHPAGNPGGDVSKPPSDARVRRPGECERDHHCESAQKNYNQIEQVTPGAGKEESVIRFAARKTGRNAERPPGVRRGKEKRPHASCIVNPLRSNRVRFCCHLISIDRSAHPNSLAKLTEDINAGSSGPLAHGITFRALSAEP